MFSSRRAWLEHERLDHHRRWQCFEHAGTFFPTAESLQNHLINGHNRLTPVQVQAIIQHSEVSIADERKTCPFCLQAEPFPNGLHYHMAFHMESLSLFSIPKGAETSDDVSVGGSDKPLVQDRMSQLSLSSGPLSFPSPASSRISGSVSDVAEVLSVPSDTGERSPGSIYDTTQYPDLLDMGPESENISRLVVSAEEGRADEVESLLEVTSENHLLELHDEDYFDRACAKLVAHIQEWVLRFSKVSEQNDCHSIQNDISDRFKNSMLDGENIEKWLQDKEARCDVFESVTATMIWEFVFTRCLFGLPRQHEDRLELAEKNLATCSGSRDIVLRWRATVLKMLCKHPDLEKQQEISMTVLAENILQTLSRVLPPPEEARMELFDLLCVVLKIAIKISIQMRTQVDEHLVLPPLQPEFDERGNVASQVFFNSALMNERKRPSAISNYDLEKQKAVVSVVLFPLVVKKRVNDDEVVVYSAQVLVQKDFKQYQ